MSGSGFLTAANGIGRMLSIVTMPILTKALSPDAYGVSALVGTVISLTACIALLGIDMSYARVYFTRTGSSRVDVETFAWRFALAAAFISSLATGVLWLVFAERWFHARASLAPLVAIGVFASLMSTMAQIRTRLLSRYLHLSLALIGAGIISAGISIGVAKVWRHDEMALVLGMVGGYVLTFAALGTPNLSHLARGGSLTSPEKRDIAKIGLAGAVTAPMFWLLSSSDRWFLGHFRSTGELGVYSLGASVGIVGMMINSAITAVWLPEAVRLVEEDPVSAHEALGRLATRLVMALAVVWLAVAAGGSELVLMLSDTRFHQGARYVPYIAAGVFFYGCLQIANTGLLLANKLQLAAACWLIGGAASLVLNYLLIPRFGALAAAQVQCASFALISASVVVLSQRHFAMHIEWRQLGTALPAVGVIGLAMTQEWSARPLVSAAIKLPVGALVTLVLFRYAAPDWFRRAILLGRGYVAAWGTAS